MFKRKSGDAPRVVGFDIPVSHQAPYPPGAGAMVPPAPPVPGLAPEAPAPAAPPPPAAPPAYGYGGAPAPQEPYGYGGAPAPAEPYGYGGAPAPQEPYGYGGAPQQAPAPAHGYGGAPAPQEPYGYGGAPHQPSYDAGLNSAITAEFAAAVHAPLAQQAAGAPGGGVAAPPAPDWHGGSPAPAGDGYGAPAAPPAYGQSWQPAPFSGTQFQPGPPLKQSGAGSKRLALGVFALVLVVALGVLAKVVLFKPGFQMPDQVGGLAPSTGPRGAALLKTFEQFKPDDGVERLVGAYGSPTPKFVLLAEKQGKDKSDPVAGLLKGVPGGTTNARTIGSVQCAEFGNDLFDLSFCSWGTDHSVGAIATFGDMSLEQLAKVTEQARKDVEA